MDPWAPILGSLFSIFLRETHGLYQVGGNGDACKKAKRIGLIGSTFYSRGMGKNMSPPIRGQFKAQAPKPAPFHFWEGQTSNCWPWVAERRHAVDLRCTHRGSGRAWSRTTKATEAQGGGQLGTERGGIPSSAAGHGVRGHSVGRRGKCPGLPPSAAHPRLRRRNE